MLALGRELMQVTSWVGAAEHGLGVSGAKVLTTVCRYGRRNGQNSGVSKAHWT